MFDRVGYTSSYQIIVEGYMYLDHLKVICLQAVIFPLSGFFVFNEQAQFKEKEQYLPKLFPKFL